ncbi:MAG: hypothetical protein WC381_10790 [Kiritimatiellia bacterium]|jgi:hypothetical protein
MALTEKALNIIKAQPKMEATRGTRNANGLYTAWKPVTTHPLPAPAPPRGGAAPAGTAVEIPKDGPNDVGLTMKAAKDYAKAKHGIDEKRTAVAIQASEIEGAHRHSNGFAWVVPEEGLEAWCLRIVAADELKEV